MADAGIRIFISYSRIERRFAWELYQALSRIGHKPVLDEKDIAPNDPWRERIGRLILEVDAVVFVLSPNWSRSDVCRWEFRHALECGKLLTPVILKPVRTDVLPRELAARNFVYFNSRRRLFQSKRKAFQAAMERLERALRIVDEQWPRTLHALVEKAKEWRASGLAKDRLLLPGAWTDAQAWAAAKPQEEDEIPPLVLEYLSASGAAGEIELVNSFAQLTADQVRRLPTALVVADYGIIPYDDSRRLKAELVSWAQDGSQAVAGRLYAAGGGYGKTRLALEAVSQLAADGWRTGLLPRSALERTDLRGEQNSDALLDRLLADRGEKGVLIVLDYAEGRASQVERIARAALRSKARRPVRLVLLARSAGDWWDQLHRESRDIQLVFDRAPVQAMGLEIDREHRELFFRNAASRFAVRLEGAETGDDRLLSPDWQSRPPPKHPLSVGEACTPLFLAFEAYLHVRGVSATDGPLVEMAREERRHWARALRIKASDTARMGDPRVDAMHRCAAILTLAQGAPPADAESTDRSLDQMLETALENAHLSAEGEVARARAYAEVRRGMDTLYRQADPKADRLRPIQPDLLGERIVGEALARTPGLLGNLLDKLPDAAFSAFTVLGRATRAINGGALVHARDEVVAPIDNALRHVLPPRLKKVADPLLAAATIESGSLAARAEEALISLGDDSRGQASLALIRASGDYVNPNAIPARLAQLVEFAAKHSGAAELGADRSALDQRADDQHTRAAFLAKSGDINAALVAEQEAVAQYRILAKTDPEHFTPKLAESLNNLANRLADVGRRDDALASGSESVEIWQGLVKADAAPHAESLATSMVNLSTRLYEAGRPNESLDRAQEAVTRFRELQRTNNATIKSQLANALLVLSARLSSLGRLDEAARMSSEAVELCRQIAAEDKERYLPDLAMALNMLAGDLGNQEHREDALATAEEAVLLYRRILPGKGAIRPALSAALVGLATRLSFQHRYGEALAAAEEAVLHFRDLARTEPAMFLPGLAAALSSSCVALSALGRGDQAVAASAESAAIYGKLTGDPNGRIHAASHARTLITWSNILSRVGHHKEGRTVCERAVACARDLYQGGEHAILPDLAIAVGNLAGCLAKLGEFESAVQTGEEAVRLQRRLVAENRRLFLEGLAMALGGLAADLSKIGLTEEALAASTERVQLLRELVQSNRGAYGAQLAQALLDYSLRLSALGRHEQAVIASGESIEAHKQRKAEDWGLYFLGIALCANGDVLRDAGCPADAALSYEAGIANLSAPQHSGVADVSDRIRRNLHNLEHALGAAGLPAAEVHARVNAVASRSGRA